VDESAPQPLLPRYRRPLTFGGVLDETFRLYRSAWPRLMAVTALATLPGALAIVAFTGQMYFMALNNLTLNEDDPEALARLFTGIGLGGVLASVVYGLGVLLGQGGVTAMTGWLVRGEARTIWAALGVAFRKLLVMLGSGIVLGLGVLGLSLVSLPLFAIGLFGVLGGLVMLIGLAVWVNRPEERRTDGLKWLIILATPFGLPIYYGVRWSLAIPAIILENAGPVEALRRSGNLVEGRWFQVFGVWLVLGIVVAILQGIPAGLIGLVGTMIGANTLDPTGAGLAVSVAQNAASIVGSVLFGALSFIAATILFVDARNRLEGTDLAERLEQLQAGTPAVP
jgi:Membrane domain of glycerophosphoryl diester phosphodiesterase